MPKEPKPTHGIELNERHEEQPTDKGRAQDPSSEDQDREQGHIPAGQSNKPEKPIRE